MSGIVAAAQSSGCCCRPQEGCLCTDPNRSGAVIDRDLTAISVDSEMSLEDAERNNSCAFIGCTCPCAGQPTYGSPGGVQYGYQTNGAIIDPDFTEGTECDGRGCTAGCCGGCPVFSCRADFGTCIAEQNAPGSRVWSSIMRLVTDNVAGTWNWVPQQVGSCAVPTNPLLRIRKYCPFSHVPGYPTVSGAFPIDPNGQYVNMQTGMYTGANIGLLRAYKAVEVYGCCGPLVPADQCAYRARVSIGYLFQFELQRLLADPASGGVLRGIPTPFYVGGIVAHYVKPCVSPSDTVMGTYRLEYQPDYDYNEEDPECGRIRWFRERFASFPSTITVS